MCPPGVDQTGRTAQYWSIVLPTIKQTQPIVKPDSLYTRHYNSVLNPHEVHQEVPGFGYKLARYDTFHNMSHARVSAKHKREVIKQSSPLFSLPMEIMTNILNFSEQRDVISLGLTCDFLLFFAREHIDRDIRKHAGAWVDRPLATLGNYLRNLPATFFENGLAYKSVNREDLVSTDIDNGKSHQQRRFRHLPARQYVWALDKYKNLEGSESIGPRSWLAALSSSECPGPCADLPQRKTMEEALLCDSGSECAFSKASFFADSGYYLHNLTVNELVRLCTCDGIDRAHSRLQARTGAMTGKYLLDDFMIRQTRWSEYGQQDSERYFDIDPKGDWAGHRFDIVSVKVHQNECSMSEGREWRDVTGKVIAKTAWETDRACGDMEIWGVNRVPLPSLRSSFQIRVVQPYGVGKDEVEEHGRGCIFRTGDCGLDSAITGNLCPPRRDGELSSGSADELTTGEST